MASVLLVGVRNAAAAPVGPLGPVGPETITVDGNPSDWAGVAPTTVNTAVVSNHEFIWNDTTGDDTGNGSYTYPTNSAFNPGLFDITEVRITADANNLYLLIKVVNLTNAWGGSDGFSTVAGVLLIDTTLDSHGQVTARPNVNITAGQGWEYYVKIGQSGWQAENSKIFDANGKWAPIVNKGNAAFDAIEVSVPLSFIGKDGYDINGATWGFMLFLQSHAGENADGFRSVTAAGGEYVFGGCDSSLYKCPEIQDLAFSASKASQEAELGTFGTDRPATMSSSAQVTFANVGFVPDTTPPEITSLAAAPTFNQADITWMTNELANTTVWYGTTPTPTTKRSVDEFVTSHSVTLSGLDPQTTYYYRVESWDVAGNQNVSTVGSFTTLALPPANIASWNGNTFVWEDTRGDDTGDGNYVYPMESTVRWQGRGDLWYVNMTNEGNWVHVNVSINAKPETDWRERMAAFALFIDQDHILGSGARDVKFVQPESDPGHPMNLSAAPEFAWEYMVVATFQNETELATPGTYTGEMVIRNSTFDPAFGTYDMVYMSTNPAASPEPEAGKIFSTQGGTHLDIYLNRSVIGTTDNWTYIAAGLMYDDAGGGWPNGGIRQVRPNAENWVGGGANGPMNPNVYDLAYYPTTAAQQTDLSEYVSTGYTTVTRALQVNLTSKWYSLLSVANVLGISTTTSVSELKAGESAGIVSFVTNRNVAVGGARVDLTATPASAVTIGLTPSVTNAFGAAMFTVTANSVATDTTVTLTLTATIGSNTVIGSANIVVKAPVITHSYRAYASAADGVLPTGGQTAVSVVFTDMGAPVSGASVALASSNALVNVVATPVTTDANGRATFTVRAGYTESDVTATLTATATSGTGSATATVSLGVKAFVHAYSMSGTATKTVVATNDTTTVTFTFADAGRARAGVQVAITLTPTTAFDVVGDVSKTTDAAGTATFTLKAKALTEDTSVVVAASATNGTVSNAATASVSVVAQAVPPSTAGPVTQGIATEVFVAVAVVLAALAAVFAVLWLRARTHKPRDEGPGPS